ncbi:tumor necrosis factor receptor superfamily member 6B-like [Hoplias malabaricus]|uniref:tumor necrosis factor receptor superfamily member 6B-like n=1 Tax=Hoplias malabaricus TaxID=27720 RepID=UPI0034618069
MGNNKREVTHPTHRHSLQNHTQVPSHTQSQSDLRSGLSLSGLQQTIMLSTTAVLALLTGFAAATASPPPTIDIEDAVTGGTLVCALCMPGTRAREPCTRFTPTECAPCPSGSYTQFWNFMPRCLPCRAPCEQNQRERRACTPTTDRECECAPGHYWRAEQCVKHARCGPGFGVKRNGTTQSDTECARCPRGTFSEGNSANAQCTPYTSCSETHLKVLQGQSWHDQVCVTCTQLRNGEHETLIRDILPKFFNHEKMRHRKLRKFSRVFGAHRQKRQSVSSKEGLVEYISEWSRTAPDHRIWKLPEKLEQMELNTTAINLRRIFKEFQDASDVCDKNKRQ